MFGIDSGVLVVIGVLLVLAAVAAKFFSGKSSAPHGPHDHSHTPDHDHGPIASDNFGEYHPRPAGVGGCKFDPEVVRKSAAERAFRDTRPPISYENLPAPDARLQKRMVCVSENEVRDILLGLTGEKPVYIAGNAVTIKSRSSYGQGVMDAMTYVEQFYRSLGIATRRIPYKVRGRTFFVLEAELKGTNPNDVLVIGSHLDSTAGNTWGEERVAPGADDDASGTTSVMLIAAQLKELKFEKTIRFLHFTGEEQGLWGSFAYVNFLESQEKHINVICMYQLDMVGYTKSPTATRVDIHDSVDRNGSHVLVEVFARMVKVYGLNLEVEDTHNHAVDERSDHGPFQRKGKKAVLVSEEFTDDGFNPNYHTTNDRVATVNIPYMVEIIRAMIATASHWAVLK